MYERFTDRAAKIMQLANQEAQRFNHEYIGTEHILLGLVKEGSGVASNVLRNLDIDLRKIRLEVEKMVGSGPDMITMGKLPRTPGAKRVVELAIESANALGTNYVGTEHLLLGLIGESEGIAFQVLQKLGATNDKVIAEWESLMGQTAPGRSTKPVREPLAFVFANYPQAYVPIFDTPRSMPPVMEEVITILGVSMWNGREWVSRFGAKCDQKLIKWWIPLFNVV